MALEPHKQVIYDLYINERRSQKEVLEHLKEAYDLESTSNALKRQLRSWGFLRNISRSQAVTLLRAAAKPAGDEPKSIDGAIQPARATQLELYLRRNRLGLDPSVSKSLSPAQVWKIPEQILFDSMTLIKGSFESRHWASVGNELIIQSSRNQDAERQTLHAFLGSLDIGTNAASLGQLQVAREHWVGAFEHVDKLIAGQYHDIVPNIVQKINDLKAKGHPAIALNLQRYLAESAIAYQIRGPTATILRALRLVHLDDMRDIEERIMQGFADLFDVYLGPLHYNSFVMRMNFARRALLRNAWARLEDHIPSLSLYDELCGPINTSSLDIVRLRTEILHHRGEHAQTEIEADLLIQRTHKMVDDAWRRLYFLVKGYYYLGIAQHSQSKQYDVTFNMLQALQHIAEFSVIDDTGLFHPEKLVLEDICKDD